MLSREKSLTGRMWQLSANISPPNIQAGSLSNLQPTERTVNAKYDANGNHEWFFLELFISLVDQKNLLGRIWARRKLKKIVASRI